MKNFPGRAHAAHICKACSRLSAAEKAEAMTINRLYNLPMQRLTESEICKICEASIYVMSVKMLFMQIF